MQLLLGSKPAQHVEKFLKQAPIAQILTGELPSHAPSKSIWSNLYKLQLCYRNLSSSLAEQN
jgi:hypothetical protein